MRSFTVLDSWISGVDQLLRTLIVPPARQSARAIPGVALLESPLTAAEKRHVAGLMRVNHAGEVSAQALYQGQALTAQLTTVKAQMTTAAAEEVEHLAWCEHRLRELGSRPSLLNPFWYGGSLVMGALAGWAGDGWSLGFVHETECQVLKHLQTHIAALPSYDLKTKAILTAMHADEAHHAQTAKEAGAFELPWVIKQIMRGVATLLTRSSYYL